MKLTVGILARGFVTWGGGVEFIRWCITGLLNHDRDIKLRLIVLVPSNADERLIGDAFIHPGVQTVTYEDGYLIDIVRELGVDVLFPAHSTLNSDFPIPWIGYLYDFQHKYYPHFFSSQELQIRDIQFERMVTDCKTIVVNSAAVKADVRKFFPDAASQVHHFPFTPISQSDWFMPVEPTVMERYGVPNQYFIVSNQFWIHKSHATAFHALSILVHQHDVDDVHIVCTGETSDYRHPNYFRSLVDLINQLGIKDRVHILGFIPKKDQIQVMKNAIAVVQPTLFEGGPGGGCVYNAVALGLHTIISDIPVNLEVQDERARFFRSGDAHDLATKMLQLLGEDHTPVQESILRDRTLGRTREIGNCMIQILLSAVNR